MNKLYKLSENEKIDFIKFLLQKDRDKLQKIKKLTNDLYIMLAICVGCVVLSLLH